MSNRFSKIDNVGLQPNVIQGQRTTNLPHFTVLINLKERTEDQSLKQYSEMMYWSISKTKWQFEKKINQWKLNLKNTDWKWSGQDVDRPKHLNKNVIP
jgi:hypothetical protein